MTDIKIVSQEHRVPIVALCEGLSLARSSYYRAPSKKSNLSIHVSSSAHALSNELRQTILDLLHSERFVDCTPYQVYYTLLDEGHYYASIRTFYRLLAEKNETQERRHQRNHRDAIKPELMATAHNQIWSWDITKLLSVQRLVYYHLYVMIDIYSRHVVGWLIADRECQKLARDFIQRTTLRQSIQPGELTIHSDNGPSMTSHTVAELLEHLSILKTHNRPYTSNDNPFSESHFKTLKYCPTFPNRFESLEQAEQFCQNFFTWYNQEHYHSGILWLRPQSVHYGQADEILKRRHQVLLNAYHVEPARFNNRMPKQKKLKPAYINPPKEILNEEALQGGKIMF